MFEIDNNTNTIKRRPGTRKQVKSMQCVAVVIVLPCGVPCSPSLRPLLSMWTVTTSCQSASRLSCSFHTGINSYVNVTDHLLLFYFTLLIY